MLLPTVLPAWRSPTYSLAIVMMPAVHSLVTGVKGTRLVLSKKRPDIQGVVSDLLQSAAGFGLGRLQGLRQPVDD